MRDFFNFILSKFYSIVFVETGFVNFNNFNDLY